MVSILQRKKNCITTNGQQEFMFWNKIMKRTLMPVSVLPSSFLGVRSFFFFYSENERAGQHPITGHSTCLDYTWQILWLRMFSTLQKAVPLVKSFLLLKIKFLKSLFNKIVTRQCFRLYPGDIRCNFNVIILPKWRNVVLEL